MSEPVVLPARLDTHAASDIAAALGAVPADADVRVDGSAVKYFGAHCLQVLLASARRQIAAGGSLTLDDLSPRGTDHLAAMGLAPETVSGGGHDA